MINTTSTAFFRTYYFFLGEGFVWDSALAATDLAFALVLPSFKIEDALLATFGDVCLEFLPAIVITTFAFNLSTKLISCNAFQRSCKVKKGYPISII